MIREEFLARTTDVNLCFLRHARDAAALTAAGFGLNGFGYFQTLERFKLKFEMLLDGCASGGAGRTVRKDAFFTEFTEAAENRTSALTGIYLQVKITSEERAAVKAHIPAGMLPRVFDRQLFVCSKGAQLCTELSSFIGRIYSDVIDGKLYIKYPPSLLEAFIKILDDYSSFASAAVKEKLTEIRADERAVRVIFRYLMRCLDCEYEGHMFTAMDVALKANENEFPQLMNRYTALAVKGLKTVALPLLSDLGCRYSLFA